MVTKRQLAANLYFKEARRRFASEFSYYPADMLHHSGITRTMRSTNNLLVVMLLLGTTLWAQQTYPPPSSCPVLASLASSKVHINNGDAIVIWFWNQGKKTIHGAQFQLFMLDTAGNRYPASQFYQVKGEVKPHSGDVVEYPAKNEQKQLGERWAWIEGVEVHVTRIFFMDATVWTPHKGVDCKASFLNDDYDKELERRSKLVDKQWQAWRKKWNREHPDNKIPDTEEKQRKE